MTDIYLRNQYSSANIFQAVKKKALTERITSYDEYVSLVDDKLEEERQYGFLDEGEDVPGMKRDLILQWKETRGNLDKQRGKLVS